MGLALTGVVVVPAIAEGFGVAGVDEGVVLEVGRVGPGGLQSFLLFSKVAPSLSSNA